MTTLENFTADRIKLAGALKTLSTEKDGGKMWLFEVEEHLKKNGMELGPYFHESGRDKVIRRIKLQLTKCAGELALSYMSKHKVTEEAAEKAIAAILPWEKMKKIDQLPDLGGDIDDILGDL
jgi:hypothetical protein